MQKLLNFSEKLGLTLLIPFIKMAMKDEPGKQMIEIIKMLGLPAAALLIFFSLWGLASKNIKTSVGTLPSPSYVWGQAKAMVADARAEKLNKAEFEFYEITREKLYDLLTKRRALEAAGQSVNAVDRERSQFAATIQTRIDELIAEEEALSAQIEAATAAAEKAGLTDRRIAPYETRVLKFYTDSKSSLISLLSKNTKIDNAIADLKSGDEKKIKSADRKRTAYENQLSNPREYSGNGSIIDYINRSIITVLFGFALAAIIAIPLGILCGMSKNFMTAVNPLIQTFRPVSPLAWVLITIQIVDGVFVGDKALKGDLINNPFLHSAITVALCSLWATLSNTALGVSSVSTDYMNVAKVLKLNWFNRIIKIVIPSAVPYIFTGLRITLGVGWMVLIVSEMMATSRGLGWFIDQQYQNNKVESLANIIVCIFIIGIIGAILDRIMFILHKSVSFNDEVSA
ncbi:MAG TPA: ABC transporter permease subunit [Pontiella sp.]